MTMENVFKKYFIYKAYFTEKNQTAKQIFELKYRRVYYMF